MAPIPPLLRFAPSPTGALHLGGLRMALYNHLYARKLGGKWILRVEDTDLTRFVPGSIEAMRKALEWAGLDYDYGPERGGPHAPYYQSQRLDLYRSYADKLLDKGHAYRCFCTPDRLAATRERLNKSGSSYTYDKQCLHLSDEEAVRKVKAGEKYIVRLNDSTPPTRPPSQDLVFGTLKDAHLSLATDPVLMKSDGFPTYHLASIVDDFEMGITHVFRGEEWMPSLPLHLDLYAHLAITPPKFAHIPVLLNPDGTKMSKRKGDVRVLDFIEKGWEPSALLNWLALAGWGTTKSEATTEGKDAPDSTQIMSIDEMTQQFDISVMTNRSSSLDPAKLEYINKQHLLREASTPQGLDSLARRVLDKGGVAAQFSDSEHIGLDNVKQAIVMLEARLTNINDVAKVVPYFFVEPDWGTPEARSMLAAISADQQVETLKNAIRLLGSAKDWDVDAFMDDLKNVRKEISVPSKAFWTVLRYAIAGMKDGPPVVDSVRLLGRDRTTTRFQKCLESLQA